MELRLMAAGLSVLSAFLRNIYDAWIKLPLFCQDNKVRLGQGTRNPSDEPIVPSPPPPKKKGLCPNLSSDI